MILPCKTGQPEWVMRNALVLTALANFRVVGNSSFTGLGKSCPSSGKWGPLIVVNRPITLHKPIQGYRSVAGHLDFA